MEYSTGPRLPHLHELWYFDTPQIYLKLNSSSYLQYQGVCFQSTIIPFACRNVKLVLSDAEYTDHIWTYPDRDGPRSFLRQSHTGTLLMRILFVGIVFASTLLRQLLPGIFLYKHYVMFWPIFLAWSLDGLSFFLIDNLKLLQFTFRTRYK